MFHWGWTKVTQHTVHALPTLSGFFFFPNYSYDTTSHTNLALAHASVWRWQCPLSDPMAGRHRQTDRAMTSEHYLKNRKKWLGACCVFFFLDLHVRNPAFDYPPPQKNASAAPVGVYSATVFTKAMGAAG